MEQKSKKINLISGSLIVELLVAFGLFALLMPALLTGLSSSVRGSEGYGERVQATGLLREGEEKIRAVRETGWNNILANYSDTVGNFTREIEITDVDPSLKRVDIVVSWDSNVQRTASSVFYLSRYLGNTTIVETTKAQFDLGVLTNTVVTNVSGGEVSLGAGGKADWCEPSISAIDPIDLPKSGVANAITAIEGVVFAGTGENASGVSFAKVAIDNSDPPIGLIAATFDGYKTNGVFGDANYAYLATDNNSKEIEIIDLENIISGKYQEAGSFNAPGNGNGGSVFVTDDYGYMTSSSGNKLYNFNKPGNSFTTDADGVSLDNAGNKVSVVGNYAYIATNGTVNQLNIVDLTNPSNLTNITSFSVNGLSATDIYVNSAGTRAYLVTSNSATLNEFFILDITNKNSPNVIGTYDTNGMSPKGVTIVPGNKAIVVGTGGSQQYQVVDITTETLPVHCTSGGRSGGLSVATGVNGVSSILESDGDAYSYIITGDASSELKIIEGGPGGKYANTGSFESQIIDLGAEVAFNNFVANSSIPSGTSVSYQFAGSHQVNGSCTNASYTFTDPIDNYQIPLDADQNGFENPARCFKYKVLFSTSDSAYTPNFGDITVNYSP